MKKSNEIKVVKKATLTINIIVFITTFIGFYIQNIYLLYFNMGMLIVLMIMLVLVIILDSERNDN